jgi:hypothetical protein
VAIGAFWSLLAAAGVLLLASLISNVDTVACGKPGWAESDGVGPVTGNARNGPPSGAAGEKISSSDEAF